MKKIVIQGLGYVGFAMLTFCAGAKKNNKYLFEVTGIEKIFKWVENCKRISSNQTPVKVDDKNFSNFYSKLAKEKRIKATLNENEYSNADIVFVCSNVILIFLKIG